MAYYKHKAGCQCVFHTGRRNHKPDCRCVAHSAESRGAAGRFKQGYEPKYAKPLKKLLVQNGQKGLAQRIKRRLVKEGLIEDLCNRCGIGPEWNNEPLTLQLDHVNGAARDWRLENLQVLCPNCHAQTSTFAGANAKRSEVV